MTKTICDISGTCPARTYELRDKQSGDIKIVIDLSDAEVAKLVTQVRNMVLVSGVTPNFKADKTPPDPAIPNDDATSVIAPVR